MDIGDTEPDFERLDRGEWAIRDEEVREYVRRTTEDVASLVRSTVGPRTLEKLVETRDHQDEPETILTADADEILKGVERGGGFDDPVAALFVDAVDSMQRALADGTGTAVVLAEALVHRGLDLVESGLHPNTVVAGYALAAARAGTALDELARPCDPTDRELLARVAATAVTADVTGEVRRRYADQVAEAVAGLAEATDGRWIDSDDVDVIATTQGERGFHRGVVARRRPTPLEEAEDADVDFDWEPVVEGALEDANLVVVDDEMTFGATATQTTDTRVGSPAELERERAARSRRRREFAEYLADVDVSVFVSQAEVDDPLRVALTREGIAVVDRVQYPKSDVYRLARATGATVVSHVDDVTEDVVGTAGRVREVVHDDEKWTIFDECDGSAFTLVVPVELESSARQRERLVSDAVAVTTVAAVDRQVVPGAGAPAAAVMHELRRETRSVPGREQLAVEAFADALEDFLGVLARNAGLNHVDATANLRAALARDPDRAPGVDLATGESVDAWEAGVVEPRRTFSQALETARSVAERLLTLDAMLSPGVDFSAFDPEVEHE